MRRSALVLSVLAIAACRRDVNILARRPPPAPAKAAVSSADPWISSPVQEHDDFVLDVRAISEREIVVAIKNDNALRLARTNDGGRTWAYAPVDVPGPQLFTAYFMDNGAAVYVMAMNAAAAPSTAQVRVNDLSFTSSS